jgi:hypothetical protein
MEEPKLYIAPKIAYRIPTMVRNELAKMPANKQSEFIEEFERKKKSAPLAYLFLVLIFAMHYGYMKKWGLQVVFWITGGGLLIWWIVDLFRIPGMIKDYNRDVALEVMRDMKAIS